jgi:hypothetical protein
MLYQHGSKFQPLRSYLPTFLFGESVVHLIEEKLNGSFCLERRSTAHYYLSICISYRTSYHFIWKTFFSRTNLACDCNTTALHLILIGAMEIVGLVVKVRMLGHPVHQTSHHFIFTCRVHASIGVSGEIADTK